MRWTYFIWDPLPEGNVEHVEEHGLTQQEVQYVMEHPSAFDTSDSSELPCLFGYTPDGRYIIVVYEEVDEETVSCYRL